MADAGKGEFDWRGWLLPGAGLLVAAVLLVVTLKPRDQLAVPPSSTAASSGGSTADEHEVVTDEGPVSFRLDGDKVVVGLETAGGRSELGRAQLPFIASAPPDGTASPSGSAMFLMVCGEPGTPSARRYVFGHLDAARDATYSGPQAVGHGTSDGLFLFALVPGTPDAPVTVTTSDGSKVGFGNGAFDDVATDGAKQPSGCVVAG